MVYCITSTRATVGKAAAIFAFGSLLFGYGLHLSYVNIAPQQARIKERNDFVRARLKLRKGE